MVDVCFFDLYEVVDIIMKGVVKRTAFGRLHGNNLTRRRR